MVEQELSVPDTVLPVTTINNESQQNASYLNNWVHQVIPNNNVSVCSSDSFKETFSNTNLDSVSKLSPKVHAYNNEIAKFVQEVNIKYGILLDYTALEISEVLHSAETFQVLARSSVQQEVQPL